MQCYINNMKLIAELHYSYTAEVEVPDNATEQEQIAEVLKIQVDFTALDWSDTDVFKNNELQFSLP